MDTILAVAAESFKVSWPDAYYSEACVEKQLRKGCQQLRDRGNPGIVAFNLDDTTPERALLVQPTRQAASDVLHRTNIAFMQRHQRKLQDMVMSKRCDGVLLATTAQADIEGMSPRFNRVTEFTLWTVMEAGADVHLRIAGLRRLIDGAG